jgi:hypothetical protein
MFNQKALHPELWGGLLHFRLMYIDITRGHDNNVSSKPITNSTRKSLYQPVIAESPERKDRKKRKRRLHLTPDSTRMHDSEPEALILSISQPITSPVYFQPDKPTRINQFSSIARSLRMGCIVPWIVI